MFLFVTLAEVESVADRFGATPFDIEGVFWSHRGPSCTDAAMRLNDAFYRWARDATGETHNWPTTTPRA